MAATKQPPQPSDRLREIAADQYRDPLAKLPGGTGERLVAAAVAWFDATLARSPHPQATAPRGYALWAAETLRAAMCDLADTIELRDGRLVGGTLKEVRASHYAAERLGAGTREVWLLTDYLGLSAGACARLLGIDVAEVGRQNAVASEAIGQTVRGEVELLTELSEINLTVWPPERGVVDKAMIGLARDAAHVRMQHAGFFGTTSRADLLAYYRTFARLYRGPRVGVCQGILNIRSNTVADKIKGKAQKTLGEMHNEARARLALRRLPEFTRVLEPVADDWFAMAHDACLPVGPPAGPGYVRRIVDVASLVDEPPDVVKEAITGYRLALQKWTADNPTGTA